MADALIKHSFLSPYLDGPDATKLQPSNWNAALILSAGNDGEFLVRDSASATGAAWVVPGAVAAAAGTLTGNTLAAGVLTSSLTSVGTLASLTVTAPIAGSVTGAAGSAPAGALTGATLAANVLASSLTSLGTIASLSATKVLAGDGTVGAPALSFTSSPTTGLYRSAADVIAFGTAGVLRWTILADGRLTAPTDNSYDIGASGASRPRSIYAGTNVVVGGIVSHADGTSGAPALAFTSEPTLGFWRSSAGITTHQGNLAVTGGTSSPNGFSTGSTSYFLWLTRAVLKSPANGVVTVTNAAETVGSQLKVDALPAFVSGGGGTTPAAVLAGSTPFAGSINVGTGTITSPIVINWGGTAFPSAPFCAISQSAGTVPTTYTASTTQLTLACSPVWAAGTVISWIAASSK